MKIAIHPPLDEARLAKVRAAAAPAVVVNAADVEDADAFLGKITPELLSRAAKLRWVQAFTVSLEHYMFPALAAHPCALSNMRGLFSDVVADHAIGFVLCFARNLHLYIRRGTWAPIGGENDRPSMASGPGTVAGFDRAHVHLADATLGVVGMGGIGSEVARRAAAFGMRVLGHDPKVSGVPLDTLLAESDYVVIAAPHTPSTAGLFDRATIRKMKRSAVLINVGRGAIVKLDDLTAALEAGEIAGAALDVFEIEPLPPSHPLWARENVILTPHVAAASVRIAERHLAALLDNVRRFVRGEPPLNLVDKAQWY
ncbi:MAG TPA: D-2-hydroxyacid dehydrogenase [Planctomycetota bacterium]